LAQLNQLTQLFARQDHGEPSLDQTLPASKQQKGKINQMSWQSAPANSVADLERLLHHVEDRLNRLSRTAARTSAAAPRAVDRVGDSIAAALNDIAERFRGGVRSARTEASQFGDEAFKMGNDTLRTLTREVEQRPLVTLAVAFGVGMIAAGLLARKS
jgi:ElaB/YqjD/DUF883 family membrane-anchored ribosome-binding protein